MSPALHLDSRRAPVRPGVDQRLPTPFVSAVGFLATLAVAAVLEWLTHDLSPAGDLAVMAAIVGLLGWWSRWPGALACAGLGWLMLNGFVTDQYGALRWHGPSDALRLAVLLGCAIAATGVHGSELSARRHRECRAETLERAVRPIPAVRSAIGGERRA